MRNTYSLFRKNLFRVDWAANKECDSEIAAYYKPYRTQLALKIAYGRCFLKRTKIYRAGPYDFKWEQLHDRIKGLQDAGSDNIAAQCAP